MGGSGLAVSDKPEEPFHYPAEKARQGEIILRKRWQRIVFIAGLVGLVLLAFFIRWAGYF